MIYKEVSSNLEFLYHYMVRVFCLQVQCMCIKFSIYVVAPDYLKCYVIILHNTCYDNLILMGISFFFSHSSICHSVEFIHFTKLHITFKNNFYGTDKDILDF